jgi:hypothetical protein
VGITQPLQRGVTSLTDGLQFLEVARDFYPFHSVQTGSGAHPTFYSLSTGDFSAVVKRPGRVADHSPLSSTDFKKSGATCPLPHTSSRRSALLIKHREIFTLLLPLPKRMV